MNTSKTIYQVDAFTSEPFKGNPAGVCILEDEPSGEWMQNVAMEMNLSETAFVFRSAKNLVIRYYTPESEIPLCGHATLSAAHILYDTGVIQHDNEILFSSKAGVLRVRRDKSWIIMNFPLYTVETMEITQEFISITGICPEKLYRTAHGWTLVLMKNEDEVKDLSPNFSSMKNTEFGDLIVTAASKDPEYDFCVRCFAPALGIDEDPVTGSAHCALVPFWAEKTGKKEFISHQISKRGGILKVSLKGDRVEISGQAKTIFKADLFV